MWTAIKFRVSTIFNAISWSPAHLFKLRKYHFILGKQHSSMAKLIYCYNISKLHLLVFSRGGAVRVEFLGRNCIMSRVSQAKYLSKGTIMGAYSCPCMLRFKLVGWYILRHQYIRFSFASAFSKPQIRLMKVLMLQLFQRSSKIGLEVWGRAQQWIRNDK